jgi:hypothetical protein
MDNIDEVDPSAIVVSARDFPRHWKILVQFVRGERGKEACPIILLKGASFGAEETAKAFFLGVSGVLDDALETPEKLNRLQNILGRNVPVKEKRAHPRFLVEPWHRVGFAVAGFPGGSIGCGTVLNICDGGLAFVPAGSRLSESCLPNSEFAECSLRVGEAILSPTCRLARSGKTVAMEFASFPKGERHVLQRYLEELRMPNYGYGIERIAS